MPRSGACQQLLKNEPPVDEEVADADGHVVARPGGMGHRRRPILDAAPLPGLAPAGGRGCLFRPARGGPHNTTERNTGWFDTYGGRGSTSVIACGTSLVTKNSACVAGAVSSGSCIPLLLALRVRHDVGTRPCVLGFKFIKFTYRNARERAPRLVRDHHPRPRWQKAASRSSGWRGANSELRGKPAGRLDRHRAPQAYGKYTTTHGWGVRGVDACRIALSRPVTSGAECGGLTHGP